MHPLTPAATTPATDPSTDPHPGLSEPVNRPLLALLEWSTDPYDCEACAWTCEPVTRPLLGDRWGAECAYHHGALIGTVTACDWHPDDWPGHLYWRRAARALAAVLWRASHGDYTRSARRYRRSAVWGSQ